MRRCYKPNYNNIDDIDMLIDIAECPTEEFNHYQLERHERD